MQQSGGDDVGVPLASTSSSTSNGNGNGAGTTDQNGRATKKQRRTSTAATSPSGEGDHAKPHVCDWTGCGKAFSRPDHLNRHRLNHSPATIYKCRFVDCPKVFVRNDLLVRHEERHERKGETGATGALSRNSITSARKLQTSGAIPSEVPAPPHASASTRSRAPSAGSSATSPSVEGVSPGAGNPANGNHGHLGNGSRTGFDGMPQLSGINGIPPSGSSVADNRTAQEHMYNFPSAPIPFTSHPLGPSSQSSAIPSPSNNFDPFGSAASASMPPPSLTQYSIAGPSNGMYAPSPSVANLLNPYRGDASTSAAENGVNGAGVSADFGPAGATFFDSLNEPPGPQSSMPGFEEPLNFIQQSYGVPFVSASEYSWLFDPSGGFDIHFAKSRPVSPGPDFYGLNGPGGTTTMMAGAQAANTGSTQPASGITPGSGMSPEDLEEVARGLDMHAQAQGSGYGRIGTEWDAIGTPNSPEKRYTESTPQSVVEEPKPTPPPVPEPSPRPLTAASPRAQVSDGEVFNPPARPAATVSVDRSTHIDERTRLKIIDYLEAEGAALRSDQRLSRAAMQRYMEDFWLRIHETQTPSIHRASFKTNRAKIPLVLSMILLGCYFGPIEAHQLAVNLHGFFRGKVICSVDFKPRAELWLHQTIVNIIMFGKLCSTRLHHEMAHIFWSSCVTLGRRSAIFSQKAPAILPKGKEDDVETRWAAWIEEESAKRTALIIFALDVEHASLFRHSPTLSAFQIQIQLPCDEEEWEARTAQEWATLHGRALAPVPFISALKASLMAGHSPPALNPFSRIAILHGLLSVAQDLQWRDHVIGLSQPERAHNWRDMISSSYNSWKSRLDTCLAGVTAPTTQLLRASISLYAVAHITLSIDIHELQIYAGAESALGLVVSTAVFYATEARIRVWSSTKDARAACWHAAFFLRDSLTHFALAEEDLAGCLHHRWCVFIATLTLYCYGRATSGRPGPRSADYKTSALRFLDALCCDSPEGLLLVSGKNNSLDLCQLIQEYIETSRWEIAQEGAKILRRLLTNPTPGPPAQHT